MNMLLTSHSKQPDMLVSVPALDFSAVIDSLDVRIVLLDAQLCILEWNDWIARAAGLSKTAVLGRNLCDVFPSLRQTRLPSCRGGSFGRGWPGHH